MHPYASLSDMTARFGLQLLVGLTDRGAEATGEVDEALVEKALADASEMIDGYLGAYVRPLVEVPGVVRGWCEVIAIYTLYLTEVPEKIAADYKFTIQSLKDVQAGVIRLAVAGIEPASTAGSGVMITDRERPLTEFTMKGFI